MLKEEWYPSLGWTFMMFWCGRLGGTIFLCAFTFYSHCVIIPVWHQFLNLRYIATPEYFESRFSWTRSIIEPKSPRRLAMFLANEHECRRIVVELRSSPGKNFIVVVFAFWSTHSLDENSVSKSIRRVNLEWVVRYEFLLVWVREKVYIKPYARFGVDA